MLSGRKLGATARQTLSSTSGPCTLHVRRMCPARRLSALRCRSRAVTDDARDASARSVLRSGARRVPNREIPVDGETPWAVHKTTLCLSNGSSNWFEAAVTEKAYNILLLSIIYSREKCAWSPENDVEGAYALESNIPDGAALISA